MFFIDGQDIDEAIATFIMQRHDALIAGLKMEAAVAVNRWLDANRKQFPDVASVTHDRIQVEDLRPQGSVFPEWYAWPEVSGINDLGHGVGDAGGAACALWRMIGWFNEQVARQVPAEDRAAELPPEAQPAEEG